jgi:CheY-like chemotaxis protein
MQVRKEKPTEGKLKDQDKGAPHLKVLFMDDDFIVRSVASSMLDLLGHEVHAVSEGRKAIALFEKEHLGGSPFHLVILDLYVPKGIGGAETITELKKISPHVCAIVSSGSLEDPYIVDLKTYGFRGVLPKPYTITQLNEAVMRSVSFSTAHSRNGGSS